MNYLRSSPIIKLRTNERDIPLSHPLIRVAFRRQTPHSAPSWRTDYCLDFHHHTPEGVFWQTAYVHNDFSLLDLVALPVIHRSRQAVCPSTTSAVNWSPRAQPGSFKTPSSCKQETGTQSLPKVRSRPSGSRSGDVRARPSLRRPIRQKRIYPNLISSNAPRCFPVFVRFNGYSNRRRLFGTQPPLLSQEDTRSPCLNPPTRRPMSPNVRAVARRSLAKANSNQPHPGTLSTCKQTSYVSEDLFEFWRLVNMKCRPARCLYFPLRQLFLTEQLL